MVIVAAVWMDSKVSFCVVGLDCVVSCGVDGTHRQGEPGRTRDIVGHGCLLDVLVDGLDVAGGRHGVGPCGGGVDEGLEAAG